MLFSSREPLKPTKTLHLHSWCFCLLIVVGYYVVPRAKRQDAQQALTKQTPHMETDDP